MPSFPVLLALWCALLVVTPARTAAQSGGGTEFLPGLTLTGRQSQAVDSLGRDVAQRIAALRAAGDTTSGRFVTSARRALYTAYFDGVRTILTAEQRSAFDAWYAAERAQFDAKRVARGGRPQ